MLFRDAADYEANDSRFLAQISTPMTAILDGRNSWVSIAGVGQTGPGTRQGTIRILRLLKVVVGVGSNYAVNADKLCCWRLSFRRCLLSAESINMP